MKKSAPRKYNRWTRSDIEIVESMFKSGDSMAETALRLGRTIAAVRNVRQKISRAKARQDRQRLNTRKFAKGALELATFALLLSACIVTLVLL